MELGLLAGTGWAAGVNLYAVVALLGIAGRMDWVDVPATLENPAVLAIAIAMYAIEFVADKIPYLDNLWDVVHTFIRPVGAAMLGSALAGLDADVTAWAQGGAAAGSGVLAFASHATKATARLALNASPEPFTNIGASLTEDTLVTGMVLLAVNEPTLALLAVVLALLVGAVVFVLAFKTAQRVRSSLAERRTRRHGNSRISGRPLQ